MMRQCLKFAAVALVLAAPAAAQQRTPAAPAAPALTAAERSALDSATLRGHLLFELARASQVSTRDMLSRIADPAAAGIVGWVAIPAGEATDVTYYADAAGGPVAVYRARVDGIRIVSQEVFADGARPVLGPIERRMAAARAAVADLDRRPCGPDFNVFVIPPASADAPVDVYKISPQTQRNRYPLGGHFRATVAADGRVSDVRGFTNACLDLEAPAVPAGEQPTPLAVTHLLDPVPTEIHVFLSLWMNRPLLVVTGEDKMWTVSHGRIGAVPPSLVHARNPGPPPPGPGR